MKKNDLSTARAAMAQAEGELTTMRGRQDAHRAKLGALRDELAAAEAARRATVIAGGDETPLLADLARLRQAIEHTAGNLDLLGEAEAEAEGRVIDEEAKLLAVITAAKHQRFAAARAELWEALARLVPPLRAAGLALGRPWANGDARLFEEFEPDLARIPCPVPPDELRPRGHLSALITDERRERT